MTDIIAQVDPDNCTYGTTRNSCGRTVCQKGPGEMCGGRFGRWVDLDDVGDVGDDSDDGGGDGGDGVGDKFYAACNIYLEKLKSPFKKASGTHVVMVYVSLVFSNVPLMLVMVLVLVLVMMVLVMASMWWRTIFLF